MRMLNRVLLGLGFVMAAAGNARADTYLFGYSHGGGAQALHVGTTSGLVILDTSISQFLSGSDNQGWWSPTVGNWDGNDNYIVGDIYGTDFYHDFFTFHIGSLHGLTITSVTLSVPEYLGSGGSVPVTYSLWDVSTDAATLNYNVGSSAGIYADLGTGVNYGMFAESTTNNGDPAVYHLNAAAVADLQSAVDSLASYFSIGGSLDSGSKIPEPSTIVLLGLGALGLAIARRRQVSN